MHGCANNPDTTGPVTEPIPHAKFNIPNPLAWFDLQACSTTRMMISCLALCQIHSRPKLQIIWLLLYHEIKSAQIFFETKQWFIYIPIAKLSKSRLGDGKGAVQQTTQESHKTCTCVSGAETQECCTHRTYCAAKCKRWLHRPKHTHPPQDQQSRLKRISWSWSWIPQLNIWERA